MSITLTNNAHTTLAANISSIDTILYVDDASSFPALGASDYFNMTIESTSGTYEIVRVTQISGTTFTVTRGQENTIAVPFNIGARVELRITVQNLEDLMDDSVADVVSDAAYGSGWDGETLSAPSKNAVYDKFVALEAASAAAYQPLDADLTVWAGVASSANGRSLVSAANYSTMRTLLGLAIGTDVQAYLSNASNIFYKDVGGTITAATAMGSTSPVIDGEAPGGDLLSVTDTSTATSGRKHQTQLVRLLTPASAHSGDERTLYVRMNSNTAQTVAELSALTAYTEIEGGGNVTQAYGSLGQIRVLGPSSVASATSIMGLVRAEHTGGVIELGRGISGQALNMTRTAGVAFTNGTGLYGAVDNQVAGTITNGFAVESDILNSSTGLITQSRAFSGNTNNLGGGTITNAYGLTTRLVNSSGTVGNYYGLYIFPNIGTAPTTNDYAIYGESTSPSYFAGSVGIGDNTPSEAKLVVGTTTANVAIFRRTDDGADGPLVTLFHNSASPAANDLWSLQFQGKDSAGNDQIYSHLQNRIVDPTSTSEDAQLEFYTVAGGTMSRRVMVGQGLMVGTGAIDLGIGGLGVENAIHTWQNTAIPAGGTTGTGYRFSSSSNFGVFFGSGAPSLTAAQGSLYLRSDGSSTSTRLYVNSNGGTTWVAITTAS